VTDIPKMSQDDIDVMQGPLPVRRRAARLSAVQALYQMDMSGEGEMCLHLLLLTNMSPSPLTFLKAAKSPAL